VKRYYINLPKPTRKPIPSLRYSIIKHHGYILLEGYFFIFKTTQYTCNTPHRLSRKYIGFHNLKHGGVLHSPTKTYKQNNTLLRVFNKNHGLNYFNINFQRGIVYGKEYSMHMDYPLVRYPLNTLGFKTYLLKFARVLHSHSKKPTPSLGYFNN